jgi:sporulation protein YlmC with PRC-barrel domain
MIPLVRDLLDKQLVDRNKQNIGKVDGVVMEVRNQQPPRIAYIEVGAITLSRRLHPRIEKWAKRLAKKLGLVRAEAYLIPWEKVVNIGINIEIDFDVEKTAVFELERRLRKHIIEHIPGA